MGVITEIERQKYFAYLDGVADGLNESRNNVNDDTGIKLDETIKRYESNAEFERNHGNLQGCLEFRQLAGWLRELKMYRHYLLKAEVEPQESEDKCKDCKWRKDIDEVFRRGVNMEDFCAACHIRSNRK